MMQTQTIRQIAQSVRSGTLTARSLIESAIACHNADSRQNESLGAYIVFDADGARAQADAIDAQLAEGIDPGPLAGIAVSVKDLYGVEGLPIRAGTSRPLAERWQREGFLVRALRDLGAVIVGKTHTVELAFGGVGLNPHTGTPVNPWDAHAHRAPGGSSSGAGVSLWEGSALIALGSDTGGSVRIPAAATGVVGHRQTTGRWPTTGVVPLSTTLDTVGLLTRTARDSQYVFGLIDARAGHSTAKPGAGRSSLPDAAANWAGVRIGIPRPDLWHDVQPDIVAALNGALAELEEAGAELIDFAAPELHEAGERYLEGTLVQPERFESLERELPGALELLDPIVGKRLAAATGVSATRYIGVLRLRQRLSVQLQSRMKSTAIDLLAAPTIPITPPALATLADLESYRAVNRAMLSRTGPVGMLDMCAVSLPVGLDDAHMPVGLQLIGQSGADSVLLERAVAAEAVLGTNLERLGKPPRAL